MPMGPAAGLSKGPTNQEDSRATECGGPRHEAAGRGGHVSIAATVRHYFQRGQTPPRSQDNKGLSRLWPVVDLALFSRLWPIVQL